MCKIYKVNCCHETKWRTQLWFYFEDAKINNCCQLFIVLPSYATESYNISINNNNKKIMLQQQWRLRAMPEVQIQILSLFSKSTKKTGSRSPDLPNVSAFWPLFCDCCCFCIRTMHVNSWLLHCAFIARKIVISLSCQIVPWNWPSVSNQGVTCEIVTLVKWWTR